MQYYIGRSGKSKSNIIINIFFKEFSEEKYKKIIPISQLENDLKLVTNDDNTEINNTNSSVGNKILIYVFGNYLYGKET